MNKYQIHEKSQYFRLILLRDELESHYETLSKSPSEEKDFIRILELIYKVKVKEQGVEA
jgi:hypothetical protein